MNKKIIYLLFFLSLTKLYYIADKSVNFSSDLLLTSFKKNAGEKSSLKYTGIDVIPIRDFFVNNNISEFELSEEIMKNHNHYYQKIIEFTYPVKIKKKTNILVALKSEQITANCNKIYFTKNFNIHECK